MISKRNFKDLTRLAAEAKLEVVEQGDSRVTLDAGVPHLQFVAELTAQGWVYGGGDPMTSPYAALKPAVDSYLGR